MSVYVVNLKSESGDTHTLVFARKPDKSKILRLAYRKFPEEFPDPNPTDFDGTFLYIDSITKAVIHE